MPSVGGLLDYARWRMRGRPVGSVVPGYDAFVASTAAIGPDHPNPDVAFSVVMPVHDPDPAQLSAAIGSVGSQTHERWELVLVDDGSKRDDVRAVLDTAAGHPQTMLVRNDAARGIAEATNAGVERATAPWIVFVDHDDVMAAEALAWLSTAAGGADVIYSDEDQLDPNGVRTYPFFKPAWSPRLLLGMNYINHLTAVRRTLIDGVGGLREEFSGAQDHDLLLRCAAVTDRVAHVPMVLYHWRQAEGSVAADPESKTWAVAPARTAIQEAVDRSPLRASVIDASSRLFRFRLEFEAPGGSVELITETDTAAAHARATASPADLLVFTAGTRVSPEAVNQMCGWLDDPDVRVVGPKVLDAGGALASCGWIVQHGTATPYGAGHANVPVPFLETAREVRAVDGVGLTMRRDDYLAAGGFDPSRGLREAGVALSARLAESGVAVAEPAVALNTAEAAGSFPMPIDSTDPYVSPHLSPHDGMTLR